MRNTIILSPCLCLLLLGCGDELASTAATNKADSEAIVAAKTMHVIPVKGEVLIHPTAVEPTADPLIVHVFYEAEGEATHLGHYQEIGDYLLHSNAAGVPIFVSDATITLTAANKDQIFIANLTGTVSLTGDPEHPNVVDGVYDYAGGTGRFASASGHCEFQAIGNSDGTVVSRFQGEISTVGSGN